MLPRYIKRLDITKPSYNKVSLLVPALYISLFFYPDIMRNVILKNVHGPKDLIITRFHCITRSFGPRNFVCFIRYFVVSLVNKQYKTKEINSLGPEKLVCYIRYFCYTCISDLFISSFQRISEQVDSVFIVFTNLLVWVSFLSNLGWKALMTYLTKIHISLWLLNQMGCGFCGDEENFEKYVFKLGFLFLKLTLYKMKPDTR